MPYKLQSCDAKTAVGKSRCPLLTSTLGRKRAGQADASAAQPWRKQSKASTTPPPPAGAVTPADIHGCACKRRWPSPTFPWAASMQRKPPHQWPNPNVSQAKRTLLPPPLPVPSPPQTSTDAPASAADPPQPLPWAASAEHKPPHQRPNPNASQAKRAPLSPPCCPGLRACSASRGVSGPTLTWAKQSKRHCPPPAAAAAAAAAANVHGCAAANALTLPLTPPCRLLPNNSAALRCHFLCGNGAGGANYLEKWGVYFFLKMELIWLYVHRVKWFSVIRFLWPKQVTAERWGGWLWKKISAAWFYYLFTLSKELRSGAEWRREGLQSCPCPNQAGRKKKEIFFIRASHLNAQRSPVLVMRNG